MSQTSDPAFLYDPFDLATLTPEVRAKVLQQLNSEHCTCGCGLTLAQCRIDDPTCAVSLPLAQDLVKKIDTQVGDVVMCGLRPRKR